MIAMAIASGSGKPPLIFKGSALFQLHVVKAEKVRPFIAKELRIVETLGYTVGGFFLAEYEDSPFGAFDELVVIAGIVRNDQTSCAWATKVFVNSDEARDSGRKEFGLPSQFANFSKKFKAIDVRKSGGFLNFGNSKWPNNYKDIQIREIKEEGATDSCSIRFKTPAAPDPDFMNGFSLPIKLSLPSLSGLTEYNPHLLGYTCQVEARVRTVAAVEVSDQLASESEDRECSKLQKIHQMETAVTRNCVTRIVAQSRSSVAIEFNSMKMIVNSPTVISQR